MFHYRNLLMYFLIVISFIFLIFLNISCIKLVDFQNDVLLKSLSHVERIVYVSNFLIYAIEFNRNYNKYRSIYDEVKQLHPKFKITFGLKSIIVFDFTLWLFSSISIQLKPCNNENAKCVLFVLINTLAHIPFHLFQNMFIIMLLISKGSLLTLSNQLHLFDGKLSTVRDLKFKFNKHCELNRKLYETAKWQMFFFISIIFFELCYGAFSFIDLILVNKGFFYKWMRIVWCSQMLIKSYYLFKIMDELKLNVRISFRLYRFCC